MKLGLILTGYPSSAAQMDIEKVLGGGLPLSDSPLPSTPAAVQQSPQYRLYRRYHLRTTVPAQFLSLYTSR